MWRKRMSVFYECKIYKEGIIWNFRCNWNLNFFCNVGMVPTICGFRIRLMDGDSGVRPWLHRQDSPLWGKGQLRWKHRTFLFWTSLLKTSPKRRILSGRAEVHLEEKKRKECLGNGGTKMSSHLWVGRPLRGQCLWNKILHINNVSTTVLLGLEFGFLSWILYITLNKQTCFSNQCYYIPWLPFRIIHFLGSR